MKKVFIMVAVAMVCTACSSFKPVASTDKGRSEITIALDRAAADKAHSNWSSNEDVRISPHHQRIDTVDKKSILQAQRQLKQLGYHPGPIDGLWGAKTKRALKKFQQDNSLPATGDLSQATIQQLMSVDKSDQQYTGGVTDRQHTYSIMDAEEARQLIETHIRQRDIRLETRAHFRNPSGKSGTKSAVDVFQGVRFDSKNYVVFAHCKPAYRMISPAEDLQIKLTSFDIDLPDDHLSFTFNGLFFSTVNLEVKNSPVFSYTEQDGYIADERIPAGGYRWMIGEFGMKLGSTFIFFPAPLQKSFIESWDSNTDEFAVKMTLPPEKGKGLLLDLYRP
jgi:hypothetical protein